MLVETGSAEIPFLSLSPLVLVFLHQKDVFDGVFRNKPSCKFGVVLQVLLFEISMLEGLADVEGDLLKVCSNCFLGIFLLEEVGMVRDELGSVNAELVVEFDFFPVLENGLPLLDLLAVFNELEL